MKRLLAWIGMTYFTVLAVVFCFDKIFSVIAAGISLLAALIFFFIRKIRKTVFIPAIALAALAACCVNLGYTTLAVEPLYEQYAGENRAVSGVIRDEGYSQNRRYYYPVTVHTVDGEEASFRLLMSLDEPLDCEPFDTISFRADLQESPSRSYVAKGYYLYATSTADVRVSEPPSRPPYYFAIRVRQHLRDLLTHELPPTDASLCEAILLGDRYAMSAELKEDFRMAGASYLVVVSGMHFSILISLLLWILRRSRIPRAVGVLIAAVFTVGFMALTGFSPSVMRSGIMMLVFLLSRLLWRIHDPLNALGLACLVIPLLMSPCCVGDIGLILSVAATFAIIMWASRIYSVLCIKPKFDDTADKPKTRGRKFLFCSKRAGVGILNAIIMLISTSLAANILVLPISIIVFHAVSMVTLLSALLLYGEIYLLMVLGVLFFVLSVVPFLWPITQLVAALLYELCEIVRFVVRFLSDLPFSYVYIHSVFIYVWLGVTAVLLLLAILLCRGYRYTKYAALLSVILLLCGTVVSFGVRSGRLNLNIYSAGEGEFVTLEKGYDTYILSMNAPKYSSYSALSSLDEIGRAKTAAVITSYDYKNFLSLRAEGFAFSTLLLYDSYGTGYLPMPVEEISGDTDVALGDDLALRLYPDSGGVLRYLYSPYGEVLILPRGMSADSVPEDLRSPRVLVLSHIPDDYTLLQCDTVVCCTDNRAEDNSFGPLRQICNTMLYADKDVSIPLR